jgi:hypothetical protein
VALVHCRWKTAGLLVCLGTLAKLTMLFFPLCAIVLALVHPTWRSKGVLWLCAGATVALVPCVLWNFNHSWVSLQHTLGHANNAGKPNAWWSPFTFLSGQIGLWLGVWWVAWLGACWKHRRTQEPAVLAAVWFSVPLHLFFVMVSTRTAGQPNWAAPAYLGGMVLALGWLHQQHRRWLIGAVVVGLVVAVGLRFPQMIRPTLARLVPPPSADQQTPIRRLDPTVRLQGWQALAQRVDELLDAEQTRTGERPLVAGMMWNYPGELAFYLRGQPVVYSFGPALADRTSQYDIWRPNPLADAQVFAGKSFVYVGDKLPDDVFDEMLDCGLWLYEHHDIPLMQLHLWVCRGYRGFRHTKQGQ